MEGERLSTSGYCAPPPSKARNKKSLSEEEIEKELYNLDNIYQDSDSDLEESDSELVYEKQIEVFVEDRESELEIGREHWRRK